MTRLLVCNNINQQAFAKVVGTTRERQKQLFIRWLSVGTHCKPGKISWVCLSSFCFGVTYLVQKHQNCGVILTADQEMIK